MTKILRTVHPVEIICNTFAYSLFASLYFFLTEYSRAFKKFK